MWHSRYIFHQNENVAYALYITICISFHVEWNPGEWNQLFCCSREIITDTLSDVPNPKWFYSEIAFLYLVLSYSIDVVSTLSSCFLIVTMKARFFYFPTQVNQKLCQLKQALFLSTPQPRVPIAHKPQRQQLTTVSPDCFHFRFYFQENFIGLVAN